MPILYIIVIAAIAIAVFAAGFADEKRSRQRPKPLDGGFSPFRATAASDEQRMWRNTSGRDRGVA